ncbi:MAG: hypothetical protein WEA77_06295 [Hyphomonas sp.]|uniref:hypothetical protein n=1 Tax=Hyphomonas sp. TaxID=87 RepID=UPI0034A08DE0
MLYRLLDRQMRSLTDYAASDRAELPKHIFGFRADEADRIVQWDAPAPLRSVG